MIGILMVSGALALSGDNPVVKLEPQGSVVQVVVVDRRWKALEKEVEAMQQAQLEHNTDTLKINYRLDKDRQRPVIVMEVTLGYITPDSEEAKLIRLAMNTREVHAQQLRAMCEGMQEKIEQGIVYQLIYNDREGTEIVAYTIDLAKCGNDTDKTEGQTLRRAVATDDE